MGSNMVIYHFCPRKSEVNRDIQRDTHTHTHTHTQRERERERERERLSEHGPP